MHYSILVPVLNEQDNVLPMVEELAGVLGSGPAFELIFIDDGSTDATPERLAVAKARHPFVRVLRHERRCGKSAALRTGARAARADWLVTMDGDRQNDPADVPHMLALVADDSALVLVAGNRRRRADTIWKKLASRIGNGIRRALLRDACPDTACGLKLIRRDVMLNLPFFDTMHRFFPALVQAHGFRYANLLVNDRLRTAGQSKYTNLGRLLVGVPDLFGVSWLLRRSTLPATVRED